MVMPLGPSKFYGKSLPRPHIYNEVKFNSTRVDPPLPVTAPLMSWAKGARWSMGGLSQKRKRTLGTIEGSLKNLKTLEETENTKENKKENIIRKENENVRSSSGTETPADDSQNHFPDLRTPLSAKILRPKWAEEDSDNCSLVVPESTQKSVRKPSPRVRIRARNLEDVFNERAAGTGNGVSSNPRDRRTKVARSALRKEAKRAVGQIYDYVEMPDKVMRLPRKYSANGSSSEGSEVKCNF